MKICKLIIRGFQQFENTELDFTDPKTGEPADRICLIGRNGTGKSTILSGLSLLLAGMPDRLPAQTGFFAVKLESSGFFFYMVGRGTTVTSFLDARIEKEPGWIDYLDRDPLATQEEVKSSAKYEAYSLEAAQIDALKNELKFEHNGSDLVVFSSSDTAQNEALNLIDVPKATLDQALELFKRFPFYHDASSGRVSEMWRVLVYLVKKRENDRNEFETRPENLSKTKRELIDEFDREHPEVLHELAALWNPILERAGLEFDVEGASNPIQLTDNLKAYICLKSTKQNIAYNQLSSGMREFIFRIGHIFLLYFGRKIERGFLLIDEPENSLFPDFLFELMETYNRIVSTEDGRTNTQMFFATHSPLVAAQFHPHERIILEWDDSGHVTAKKGTAPIGDDPNDLLRKDFELPRLMGREGEEKWRKFLDLKKQIRRSKDQSKKADLLKEAAEIGSNYSFADEPY